LDAGLCLQIGELRFDRVPRFTGKDVGLIDNATGERWKRKSESGDDSA
jgi:hypothetical protein